MLKDKYKMLIVKHVKKNLELRSSKKHWGIRYEIRLFGQVLARLDFQTHEALKFKCLTIE